MIIYYTVFEITALEFTVQLWKICTPSLIFEYFEILDEGEIILEI